MSLSYEELKAQLEIEKTNLDEEAPRQPVLFQEVVEQANNAYDIEMQTKDLINQMEGDLYLKLKQEANAAGEKSTEKSLQSAIDNDPDMKELKAELRKAEKQSANWNGLRQSYSQRKDMLKVTSDLLLGSYRQYIN